MDGRRVLWANPVGASRFGAANAMELAGRNFGPADPHRRQVARLSGALPVNGPIRLERLRGFGAPLGLLVTCSCSRLEFPDGAHGILVVAVEQVARPIPFADRLRRLVEGVDLPVAAFTRDGMLASASPSASPLFGFHKLSEAGLDGVRIQALAHGRAEAPIGLNHMVLQRVGTGADVALVALIDGFSEPALGAADRSSAMRKESAQEPVTPVCESVPSPCGEPLLKEPTIAAVRERAPLETQPVASSECLPTGPLAAAVPKVASWLDEGSALRRHPLRFMWQMDAQGRFALGSDEFTRLIGARSAASFGRLWSEIADSFGLDPEDRVANAIATQDTWSGITVPWPVDGGGRLPVELSGLPVYDRARNFAGYRGFGVCRDLDALARLVALRRYELFNDLPAPEIPVSGLVESELGLDSPGRSPPAPELPAPIVASASQQLDLEMPVETPPNVVPFRSPGEQKSPTLTPNENNAFNELARQLSERLERENGGAVPTSATAEADDIAAEPAAEQAAEEMPNQSRPEWLGLTGSPAHGESERDCALLDLLPTGILIYRLDQLLYANPAFLAQMGYPTLHGLVSAGGLDALYVDGGISSTGSISGAGTPVMISGSSATVEQASPAIEARLHTINWDGDSALALILLPSGSAVDAANPPAPIAAPAAPASGEASAEDLATILDTTAEGILMFDAEGKIRACNRSAEALFGYDGEELTRRKLADLFAPESHRAVQSYLDSVKRGEIDSLLESGRDVLGRVRQGGVIPLSMTMGRTRPEGIKLFAVFRDLSQKNRVESELREARQMAENAATAKSDLLARISHDLRTPVNAIVGFAEVMIGERFGRLGNERYLEYLKDIRASGERVISVISDMLELSRIETGELHLSFARQNLNDLVEGSVAVMQPQANRERVIIRTSLAHGLPLVVADGPALRQITLNLIANSIHLARAGGQVIVSTALTDGGEVALRVRDTGNTLSDNEVAAALEPFRPSPPSDHASEVSAVSLSLTKALVEANGAKFHIRTGGGSGTLVEVLFSHQVALTVKA